MMWIFQLRVFRARPLVAAIVIALTSVGATSALPFGEARLIEAKVGITTLSPAEQANLWRRVDEWATADSLLEFCGRKLNIFRRGWNAVTACVETQSLRKVGSTFRTKKADYVKILETTYAEPEKKKSFCDGLSSRLSEYSRIINAQIAEAKGMCDACLWC